MRHHPPSTNKIRQLLLDDAPVFSHAGKERILFNFYSELLGTSSPSSLSFDLSSLHLSNSLDSFQAETIVRPFTSSEIKLSLLAMNSNASPGPASALPSLSIFGTWSIPVSSLSLPISIPTKQTCISLTNPI